MRNLQKIVVVLCFSILYFFSSEVRAQKVFYVAPGSVENGGKGTLNSPFTSLAQAMKAVEKVNKNMSGDVTVYLRGGTYLLSSPLVFKENDSGTNGHQVVYQAYNNEVPMISGGKQVTGWTKVDGNIYKATLNSDAKLRSLFVNGVRMRMAGGEKPIKGMGSWGKFTVSGNEHWALGEGTAVDGIKFSASDINVYKNPEDVELVQDNVWTEKILCARDMEKVENDIIVKLQQPYGAILSSMAWAGRINYEKDFFIRNAFELLDSPGEFYFDRPSHTLYYYSQGEDMSKAEVIAPLTEGLFRLYGSSTASRVQNIRFEGITFSYDTWGLMKVDNSYGFGGIQSLGLAIKYIPGGNWHPTKYNSTDVPAGTIDLKNCSNVAFVRNRFEHIGSATSISMVNDVVNSEVTGNTFYDMLGNSVNVGHPQHYEIGDGDIYKAGVEGVCKNIGVTNNYIRSACLDFRQVEGITAFFVENVKLNHNDINGTPYGAITCGWWWGNAGIPASTVAKNNSICYNKAGNSHRILDDGGILYVLGEQPNSIMSHNYIFNGPRCIYPDDGSAYWTITENTILNSNHGLWLHIWSPRCHDIIANDNYVKDNAVMDNGTNDVVSNVHAFRTTDFSDEAKKIIEGAGLEEKYKDIAPVNEWREVSIYPQVEKKGK